MNRYDGANHLVRFGSAMAPTSALIVFAALYQSSPHQFMWLEFALLGALGLIISYLLIVVHEAGHVLVAYLVGIRIHAVTIGQWRRIIELRLATMIVTFRLIPGMGYVVPVPSVNSLSRIRATPFLLGGVAAELIVVVVALNSLPSPQQIVHFPDGILAFSATAVIVIGGFHLLLSLLPCDTSVEGKVFQSDAKHLLNLWTKAEEVARLRTFLYELHEAEVLVGLREFGPAIEKLQSLSQRHPDRPSLVKHIGVLHEENGDDTSAESTWRRLLKDPDLPTTEAVEMLDLLSCLLLYRERRDLLQEADGWSQKALQLAPAAITLKGTRGSVLVELGRYEDGIGLLLEVARRSECRVDRVVSSAYLAKAFSCNGNTAEAKRWMDRARSLNPTHPVVGRIAKEIGTGSSG
ncbi:MAG: hypothetical protein U1F61_02640 [Opitutaceae bacterium]